MMLKTTLMRARRHFAGACVLAVIVAPLHAAPPDDWTDLTPPDDYQAALDAINEAAQPPGENRWDEYVAIIEAFRLIEQEMIAAAEHEKPYPDYYWYQADPRVPSNIEDERLAQRIVQRAEAAGLFDRYVRLAEGDFRLQAPLELAVDFNMKSAAMSKVSSENSFLQALLTTVYLAERSNRHDTIVSRLSAIWRVTDRRSRHRHFISMILTDSTSKRVADATIRALATGGLTEAQIESIVSAMGGYRGGPIRSFLYVQWLQYRRLFLKAYMPENTEVSAEDLVEYLNRVVPTAALLHQRGAPRIRRLTIATLPTLEEILSSWDRGAAMAIRNVEKPRSAREPIVLPVEQITKDNAEENILARRLFSTSFMSLSQNSYDETLMMIDGARLIAAIELYRARNHRPPRTLNDLVPDFIDSLPVDRLHGHPYGYRRLVKPDEYGRDYLLYCYGWDGVDHGGAEHRMMNDSMLSAHDHLTDMNLDYIFNEIGRYLK